ncbi:hypothetical protein PALU110988_21910 [Paenibacillus lupini]|uniref:hypothetical protein n=1 Tax=Paenibacillus lupini TaxID=1450204 RepID=UPI001420C607|nr:hypothetical protein [Paenibacillus lupini]NIK22811.1 hypothetical protein [Paenibacillus lupini]
MLEIILFHGNTESVIDQTVDSQSLLPAYKSSGDKHYLGDGYYFYHDEEQAKTWAMMKVTRNEKYKHENWAVLKCKIRVNEENYMDLDLRENQNFFFEEMHRLKLLLYNRQISIQEYNDAFMCNHLANILVLELISKTFSYKDKHDSFPPLFSNQKSKPYGITRHFRTEKQYCIVTPHIVSSFEKVAYGGNPLTK